MYSLPSAPNEKLDVRPVTDGHDRVVDYLFKTVLRGRVPYDDGVLVLPRARGELSAVRSTRIEPLGEPIHSANLSDIVSDETAGAIMKIGRRELLVGTASLCFAGIAGPPVLSPAWHERLEAFGRGVLAPHRLAFFVAKIIA